MGENTPKNFNKYALHKASLFNSALPKSFYEKCLKLINGAIFFVNFFPASIILF